MASDEVDRFLSVVALDLAMVANGMVASSRRTVKTARVRQFQRTPHFAWAERWPGRRQLN